MAMKKEKMYQMMVEQLVADGFTGAAATVREAVGVPPLSEEEARRSSLYRVLLDSGESGAKKRREGGLDLDRRGPADRSVPSYGTKYITTMRDKATAAAFSSDGKFAAVGAADGCVRLLHVSVMRYVSVLPTGTPAAPSARPTVRTWSDHTDVVRSIDFHPRLSLLATASSDRTVRVYDYSADARGQSAEIGASHAAVHVYTDAAPIRCVQFHPSGLWLMVATDHPSVRVVELGPSLRVATLQGEPHKKAVNDICFSWDGARMATASLDGDIRLWDATSLRLLRVLHYPHLGAEVFGARFSRNGRYLLTTGRDSLLRLLDLDDDRAACVQTYAGSSHTRGPCVAVFSHNEEFVMANNEASKLLLLYRTRSAELAYELHGHSLPIRAIALSPVSDDLLTASEDSKTRFWTTDQLD